jgi:hypothetical protein
VLQQFPPETAFQPEDAQDRFSFGFTGMTTPKGDF